MCVKINEGLSVWGNAGAVCSPAVELVLTDLGTGCLRRGDQLGLYRPFVSEGVLMRTVGRWGGDFFHILRALAFGLKLFLPFRPKKGLLCSFWLFKTI